MSLLPAVLFALFAILLALLAAGTAFGLVKIRARLHQHHALLRQLEQTVTDQTKELRALEQAVTKQQQHNALVLELEQAVTDQRKANDQQQVLFDELSQKIAQLRSDGAEAKDRLSQHGSLIVELRTKQTSRGQIIAEVRDGVQQAKDRIRDSRAESTAQLAAHRDELQRLTDSRSQIHKILHEARIGIQDAKDRVTDLRNELQQSQDAATPAAEAVDSPVLRTQAHVIEALEHLARASAAIPESTPAAQQPRAVNLQMMVPDAGPLVTVVVTNYNDAEFIGECLESVRQQSLSDFACIVVDDCSTDDSIAQISKITDEDHRFTLIRRAENGGPSAARNSGLAATTTPFITFLDGDDLLLRNSLEVRSFSLLRQTDGTVAGVFSGIEQRPVSVTLAELPDELAWTPPGRQEFLTTSGECPFNLHAPLLRTDIVRSMRGFDEHMRVGAEDWELWLRMMRNGFTFEPCPWTLGIYRQKPKSLVRALPAQHLAESKRLLAQAQADADPATRVSGAPHFYELGLATYEADLVLAQRGFQYLGLAALTGAPEQVNAAIDALPASLPSLPTRVLHPGNHIDAGLRRGLGLSAPDFASIHTDAAHVRDRLLGAATSATTRRPQIPAVPSRTAHASRSPIRMYWWKEQEGGRGMKNFGDELSPLLVEVASGRSVEWAPLEECELVALGSVLDLTVMADHKNPAIWGSGFIKQGTTTGAGLHIAATRGYSSSQRCGSIGAVGDPGLLARYLMDGASSSEDPTYKIGLLPHYVDVESDFVARWTDTVDGSTVINPLDPPLQVLRQIRDCAFLFSSSLHGLIVADSLGVPNAWIELSDDVVGGGYKFADYYSCFGLDDVTSIRPDTARDLTDRLDDLRGAYGRPNLDDVIGGLVDAFPSHI